MLARGQATTEILGQSDPCSLAREQAKPKYPFGFALPGRTLHRRHLTVSQLAMIGAQLANIVNGHNYKKAKVKIEGPSQDGPSNPPTVSTAKAVEF